MENLNKYNSFLLIFTALISWTHLLYSGDASWFTKESMLISGLFLNAIVIYNFTRRRHYRVQRLGTFYLSFWFMKFILHFTDRVLLHYNIDLQTSIKAITYILAFLFFTASYLILRELETKWNQQINKKTEL